METFFDQKMNYFSDLLTCGQNLYYWKYTASLELLKSSCPDTELMASFFAIGECKSYLENYIASGSTAPLCMSDSFGLSWIASFEMFEDHLHSVHMIGPAFTTDISLQKLDQELAHKNFSNQLKKQLIESLQQISVISLTSWLQYGLMLHFSVTGEKIDISDLNYQTKQTTSNYPDKDNSSPHANPKYGTWLSEQKAMEMIENGTLDYQSAFGRLSQSANVAFPQGKQLAVPRFYKNSLITFIALSTRAAIRGGLDVETAYELGNRYVESAEAADNFSELMQINNTMFEDFVKRVHKVKTSSDVSPAIHSCCGYIDLHLSEKLSLKVLAEYVNYDEYYLAQKFKKEMHITVSQYIKERRIAEAKRLLSATNMSVQDISESLGFCNSSYFTETFRSVTDCTPVEYRNKHTTSNN